MTDEKKRNLSGKSELEIRVDEVRKKIRWIINQMFPKVSDIERYALCLNVFARVFLHFDPLRVPSDLPEHITAWENWLTPNLELIQKAKLKGERELGDILDKTVMPAMRQWSTRFMQQLQIDIEKAATQRLAKLEIKDIDLELKCLLIIDCKSTYDFLCAILNKYQWAFIGEFLEKCRALLKTAGITLQAPIWHLVDDSHGASYKTQILSLHDALEEATKISAAENPSANLTNYPLRGIPTSVAEDRKQAVTQGGAAELARATTNQMQPPPASTLPAAVASNMQEEKKFSWSSPSSGVAPSEVVAAAGEYAGAGSPLPDPTPTSAGPVRLGSSLPHAPTSSVAATQPTGASRQPLGGVHSASTVSSTTFVTPVTSVVAPVIKVATNSGGEVTFLVEGASSENLPNFIPEVIAAISTVAPKYVVLEFNRSRGLPEQVIVKVIDRMNEEGERLFNEGSYAKAIPFFKIVYDYCCRWNLINVQDAAANLGKAMAANNPAFRKLDESISSSQQRANMIKEAIASVGPPLSNREATGVDRSLDNAPSNIPPASAASPAVAAPPIRGSDQPLSSSEVSAAVSSSSSASRENTFLEERMTVYQGWITQYDEAIESIERDKETGLQLLQEGKPAEAIPYLRNVYENGSKISLKDSATNLGKALLGVTKDASSSSAEDLLSNASKARSLFSDAAKEATTDDERATYQGYIAKCDQTINAILSFSAQASRGDAKDSSSDLNLPSAASIATASRLSNSVAESKRPLSKQAADRAYKKGMQLARANNFAEAIPHFKQRYEYCQNNLDKNGVELQIVAFNLGLTLLINAKSKNSENVLAKLKEARHYLNQAVEIAHNRGKDSTTYEKVLKECVETIAELSNSNPAEPQSTVATVSAPAAEVATVNTNIPSSSSVGLQPVRVATTNNTGQFDSLERKASPELKLILDEKAFNERDSKRTAYLEKKKLRSEKPAECYFSMPPNIIAAREEWEPLWKENYVKAIPYIRQEYDFWRDKNDKARIEYVAVHLGFCLLKEAELKLQNPLLEAVELKEVFLQLWEARLLIEDGIELREGFHKARYGGEVEKWVKEYDAIHDYKKWLKACDANINKFSKRDPAVSQATGASTGQFDNTSQSAVAVIIPAMRAPVSASAPPSSTPGFFKAASASSGGEFKSAVSSSSGEPAIPEEKQAKIQTLNMGDVNKNMREGDSLLRAKDYINALSHFESAYVYLKTKEGGMENYFSPLQRCAYSLGNAHFEKAKQINSLPELIRAQAYFQEVVALESKFSFDMMSATEKKKSTPYNRHKEAEKLLKVCEEEISKLQALEPAANNSVMGM